MDNLEELKNYLGLESKEDTELFKYLEYELSQMGNWGTKITTYLRAILSRNRRYKTFIQKSDVDLYEKLLKDSMTVLDMEIKKQEEDDSIQGNNTFSDGEHAGDDK